jgi:uncharacterized RDD family membrane protein YckC
MSDYGARKTSSFGQDAAGYAVRPETALDPWYAPALYEGVLTRRLLAFLVDFIIISFPVVLATVFIAVFGVVTLGLGWSLFWLISPASAIWAIVYYGASLGGPHSATPGMRLLGIQMRTLSGAPGYFVLGAAHAVLYWLSVSLLSPFVVLVALFNRRRRLLHDFALGTVVVNDLPRR